MKKTLTILLAVLCTLIMACKKEPGEGGKAAIVGQVYQDVYENDSTFTREEAREVDVYIVYGEDGVYDDNMDTHYDGKYEFSFLYPGKYKLFAYSECKTCPSNTVAVEVSVEINNKTETVTAPDIVVDNLKY